MRTFYFYFFFLPLTGNYTFTPSWLLNSFALLILYRKYLPSFYVIYKIVCINVLHHTELKIRNELKYCKILIWSIISVGVDVNKSNKIFIIEFHTTIFICYFFFMYTTLKTRPKTFSIVEVEIKAQNFAHVNNTNNIFYVFQVEESL